MTEAGCDEAGRGALAGPVVAAAVILPKRYRNELIDDSKKLTPGLRETLRYEIMEAALSWHVAFVDNDEIDSMNILRATIKAMHSALDNLDPKPEFIIVDGNSFFKYGDIPHKTIIDGDAQYMSIAAASILAKTFRDEYMVKIHQEYPAYGWDTNKGYATARHRQAIRENGFTPYHRRSFNLLDAQMIIDF